MISEIVSEFVERLAQSGATPEIITLFVTFASRVERDVWRDGRDAKQKTADRARAYRKRKRDGRHVTDPLSSSFLLTSIGKPLTEVVKEVRVSVAGQELCDYPKNYRELFWEAYPLKKAKRAGIKALERAKSRTSFAALMAGLDRYKATQNPEFFCHPASWLNQDRWLDETQNPVNSSPAMTEAGLELKRKTEEYRRQLAMKGTENGKEEPDTAIRHSANGGGIERTDTLDNAFFQESEAFYR